MLRIQVDGEPRHIEEVETLYFLLEELARGVEVKEGLLPSSCHAIIFIVVGDHTFSSLCSQEL